MSADEPTARYSVTIRGVRDDGAKLRLADSVALVARNASREQILARLESLPWTATKSASESTARKLAGILERDGATVEVYPPLTSPPSESSPRQAVPAETTQAPSAPPESPLQPAFDAEPKPAARIDAPVNRGPEIRPLGLGELLDRAFDICSRGFWPLIKIALVPWAAIVIGLAAVLLLGGSAGLIAALIRSESLGILVIVLVVVALPIILFAYLLVYYLSQCAMIHAVACIYLGRDVRVGDAYRFGWTRVFSVIGALSLAGLIMFGVLIAESLVLGLVVELGSRVTQLDRLPLFWKIFLPSAAGGVMLCTLLYVGTRLFLFKEAAVIEGQGAVSALKRSWSLISGKLEDMWPRSCFLRLVLILHLSILVYFATYIVFSIPGGLIQAMCPRSLIIVGVVVSQAIFSAGTLLGGLFNSVLAVIVYYDLRNRKEGFDLSLLAQSYTSQVVRRDKSVEF